MIHLIVGLTIYFAPFVTITAVALFAVNGYIAESLISLVLFIQSIQLLMFIKKECLKDLI